MIRSVVLSLLFAVPCLCQTNTGDAKTSGPCSPANTGNNNTFTINCGVSTAQGQKMLEILNKILANQLDPNAVMEKLDEILKAVNPNLPVRTYSCNGLWQETGPGPNIALGVSVGGDDRAFHEMVSLNNSKQYAELIKLCLSQMDSTPDWLTSRLFCSLGYLAGKGDKVKAKQLLTEFDSKTGPAYDIEPCRQISTCSAPL